MHSDSLADGAGGLGEANFQLARQTAEEDAEKRVAHRGLGEGASVCEKRREPLLTPCWMGAIDEVGERIERNVFGHCHHDG